MIFENNKHNLNSFLLKYLVAGNDEDLEIITDDIEASIVEGLEIDDIEDTEENEETQENEEENAQEDTVKNTDKNVEEEDEPLINELIVHSGYQFEEEFEDSVEGILAFSNKVAEIKAVELVEQRLKEVEADTPLIVKEFKTFIENGNSPEKFFETSLYDVNTIELIPSDVDTLKSVIIKDLELKNLDKNKIKRLIDVYEKEGELYIEAQESLESLKKHKEETELITAKQKEIDKQNEIESTQKLITSIKEVTDKGTLKNIIIPEKEKLEFFNYVTKPVKNGMSQHELDLQEEPLEVDLQFAYFRFKKLELDSIIKQKTNTEKVKSLKDRINKNKNTSLRTATTNILEDINYDAI